MNVSFQLRIWAAKIKKNEKPFCNDCLDDGIMARYYEAPHQPGKLIQIDARCSCKKGGWKQDHDPSLLSKDEAMKHIPPEIRLLMSPWMSATEVWVLLASRSGIEYHNPVHAITGRLPTVARMLKRFPGDEQFATWVTEMERRSA